MYGYPSTEAYVKAMYGNGASAKSLRAYFELTSLANAYQTDYYNSLTYEDAELTKVGVNVAKLISQTNKKTKKLKK